MRRRARPGCGTGAQPIDRVRLALRLWWDRPTCVVEVFQGERSKPRRRLKPRIDPGGEPLRLATRFPTAWAVWRRVGDVRGLRERVTTWCGDVRPLAVEAYCASEAGEEVVESALSAALGRGWQRPSTVSAQAASAVSGDDEWGVVTVVDDRDVHLAAGPPWRHSGNCDAALTEFASTWTKFDRGVRVFRPPGCSVSPVMSAPDLAADRTWALVAVHRTPLASREAP